MEKIPVRYINTNPKNLNYTENFSIREVQGLLAGKDLLQPIHRHDFYFILALRKGRGEHIIDFTSYKINNNSIFFMRPGQVHQLLLKEGSTGYLMQFKKDFYSSNDNESRLLLRKAGNKNLYLLDTKRIGKSFSVLTDIFHESVDKKEKYSEVIKAHLGIFLIELVRQQQTREDDIDDNTQLKQDRLEEFSELLDMHIKVKKQASQYADMLNLTPYQLNTITKTALGKTSSELINEQIILESKRYLLSTSNRVKEVAYHLGYDDVSYFI